MPKIKTVFNNAQVAHVFAAGGQSHGRGSNFFFEHDTLYSYGYHYPLATRYSRGEGVNYKQYMLINSRGYSQSTARHHLWLMRAIQDRNIIAVCVPYPKDLTHPENEEYLLNKIADKIEILIISRYTPTDPSDAIQDLNNYYELRGVKKRFSLDAHTLELIKDLQDYNRTKNQEREKKKEEERLAKQAHIIESFAQQVKLWSTHQDTEYIPRQAFTFDHIRISKNTLEVETSSGASVPLRHAIAGLAHLNEGRPITGMRLGHFTVESEPDAEGFFKVGCHRLNINQIREVLSNEA